MKNFENKTIIITGAAMGLGLAAAKELAARGANLALVDYNEKSLNDAKAEIANDFPDAKIITVVADVSNEEAVKNYVDETVKAFNRIDGLYNNAGIEGRQAGMTEYASKHAVSGMTKNAALEYGRYGVNTNAIAPGAILTPMVAEAFREVNPENPKAAETEYAQRNPVKRLGLPAEVAKVVAFLLSEDASYVNGQTIAIDGGESNIYGNV
jgi:NAD(P)-dependent dehydrogenase (short-subunit alcohol dehydrogenase family)